MITKCIYFPHLEFTTYIKKIILAYTRHTDSFDDVSDDESQASDKFHCTSATPDTKMIHIYNESYLSMGLTWTGDSSCNEPSCSMKYWDILE
jgi:hypothetical protein